MTEWNVDWQSTRLLIGLELFYPKFLRAEAPGTRRPVQYLQWFFCATAGHPGLLYAMQSVSMNTWSWDFDFLPKEGSRRIVEKTGPGAFTDGVVLHMVQDLGQQPLYWNLEGPDDTINCKKGICVAAWYLFGAATPGNEPEWAIPSEDILKKRAYLRHGYAGSWLTSATLHGGK